MSSQCSSDTGLGAPDSGVIDQRRSSRRSSAAKRWLPPAPAAATACASPGRRKSASILDAAPTGATGCIAAGAGAATTGARSSERAAPPRGAGVSSTAIRGVPGASNTVISKAAAGAQATQAASMASTPAGRVAHAMACCFMGGSPRGRRRRAVRTPTPPAPHRRRGRAPPGAAARRWRPATGRGNGADRAPARRRPRSGSASG